MARGLRTFLAQSNFFRDQPDEILFGGIAHPHLRREGCPYLPQTSEHRLEGCADALRMAVISGDQADLRRLPETP